MLRVTVMLFAAPLLAASGPVLASAAEGRPAQGTAAELPVRKSEDIALYVMDVASLKLGPEHYDGIPDTRKPADAVLVTDFTVAR